jgi:dipeptidyl aminopeptidase/acylaminoacyl peptidase
VNSAAPQTKIECAALVAAAGGQYVEAAVMTSVPPHGIRVPMLLGGAHAAEAEKLLRGLGFVAETVSADLGVASSIKLWVTQGYALLEPDSPIMGDTGRMNDNYTQDLAENLDAVIDAAVDAGYVDRDRMGLGGHSYGAFSTVNAMTLVPYFKAGIAGDGMYNRSLTPFGFQSERRTFFSAQDTYLDMSPFFRADKLSGALLLYHSLEDQNVGTHPISSTRMLHALQGLGKTAALYMYPYEDHSVGTYQTDLDQWARWFAWFDVYVKNAKKETKALQP